MKTTAALLAAALAACALFPAGASALAPSALPGAVWGSLYRGDADTEGTGVQGWARQGVCLARWGRKLDLDAFAAFNWRVRTENRKYYNTSGPSLIAELGGGPFSGGVEFAWLRYPGIPLSEQSASLFAGWYASRDLFSWTGRLTPDGTAPLAMPLSSWGKFTYDLHGAEGSGSQGWIKQGADWFAPWRGAVVDTYAAYNWRLRTKNREYYNVHGPALGLALNCRRFNLGAEYSWQKFTQLGLKTKTFNIYLNWYYNWDLKTK